MVAALVGVAASTAIGETIALPAHLPGDLIVITAYHNNSNVVLVAPAGWTGPPGTGGNSNSSVWAWRIAESDSEVSGTWVGARYLVARVYRNHGGIGAHAGSGALSATIPIPGLSLVGDAETSVIDRFVGIRSGGSMTTPAGHDLEASGGAGATITRLFSAAGDEADATSVTLGASAGGRSWSIEILPGAPDQDVVGVPPSTTIIAASPPVAQAFALLAAPPAVTITPPAASADQPAAVPDLDAVASVPVTLRAPPSVPVTLRAPPSIPVTLPAPPVLSVTWRSVS